HLRRLQRTEQYARADSLIETVHFRARQTIDQLRLPHQNDLQSSLLGRVEVREQPEFLQSVVGQFLRFVDDDDEALARPEIVEQAREALDHLELVVAVRGPQ